ncbi:MULTISPECIES: hypothetical protein [unclassified Myroides]|uniref:hypothetical protein n=1 Tax=unclassified Myroides TaxID=2642485 RepID=UPI003D2F70AF
MNAFQVELVKMQRQFYQEVKGHNSQALIIPQGTKEELKFFERFFQFQLSEEATTSDFYLFQQQPFEDAQSYGSSLIEEWALFYAAWKEQHPTTAAWDYISYSKSKGRTSHQTDAYKAFYALELLCDILSKHTDNFVFIQLATTEIKDNKALQLWIKEWCELAKDSANFKLIVTDHNRHHMVEDNRYFHRYDLSVDLPKLMEAGASRGDGSKKSGWTKEYNQLIVKANFYLDRKELKPALSCLDKARSLAKRLEQEELELTVLILLAEVHVGRRDKHLAHACYKEAQLLKLNPFKQGQLGLFYGAFLYRNGEKNKAKEVFESVILLAEEQKLYAMLIEVHHQMAYLKKRFFSSGNYILHLEQAMEYSKLLPREEIKGSTIPYVASLLLKEYGKNSAKAQAIDKEMKEAVSEDWQEVVRVHSKNKRK